jgi:hypothetical protein
MRHAPQGESLIVQAAGADMPHSPLAPGRKYLKLSFFIVSGHHRGLNIWLKLHIHPVSYRKCVISTVFIYLLLHMVLSMHQVQADQLIHVGSFSQPIFQFTFRCCLWANAQ